MLHGLKRGEACKIFSCKLGRDGQGRGCLFEPVNEKFPEKRDLRRGNVICQTLGIVTKNFTPWDGFESLDIPLRKWVRRPIRDLSHKLGTNVKGIKLKPKT